MEKLFPVMLIILDFAAGLVYAYNGDLRHALAKIGRFCYGGGKELRELPKLQSEIWGGALLERTMGNNAEKSDV